MSELENAISRLKSEGYSLSDIQNALEPMMSNETPIRYPQDFYSFEGGVKATDEKISGWIKEMIEDLDTDEGIDYISVADGGAHIHIRRIDEPDVEYEITVSKKYWQTFV